MKNVFWKRRINASKTVFMRVKLSKNEIEIKFKIQGESENNGEESRRKGKSQDKSSNL